MYVIPRCVLLYDKGTLHLHRIFIWRYNIYNMICIYVTRTVFIFVTYLRTKATKYSKSKIFHSFFQNNKYYIHISEHRTMCWDCLVLFCLPHHIKRLSFSEDRVCMSMEKNSTIRFCEIVASIIYRVNFLYTYLFRLWLF